MLLFGIGSPKASSNLIAPTQTQYTTTIAKMTMIQFFELLMSSG
jgi:hypothetical protein